MTTMTILRKGQLLDLDDLMDGGEPVTIQISTRKRTFNAILTGVKKDGSFDIYEPGADGGLEQRTYYYEDVIVSLVED